MHIVMHAIVGFFIWLSSLTIALAPKLAAIAGRGPVQGDFTLAAIVVSSVAFAICCSVLVFYERGRYVTFRTWVRTAVARAQSETLLREAIIAGGEEAVAVLGTQMHEPLSFGGGSVMLQVCLAGPDATALAADIDELLSKGIVFSKSVRTLGGQQVAVRGQAMGGHAVLFMRRSPAQKVSQERATLEALPVPVWVRDSKQALTWANNAFLATVGAESLDAAIARDARLDEAEKDFERAAKSSRQIVDMRRPVMLGGEARTLAFTLRALEDGSIAGIAVDVSASVEGGTVKKHQQEMFRKFINRLGSAVAVFGPERQLTYYNSAYARLWGLSENWLDTKPSLSEILDRLREARRLPEQRDYQSWKLALLDLFDKPEPNSEELWHLPGGKSLRTIARPNAGGNGVIFLFDDVTDKLRLESAYNSLAKVQAATLNTLQDGVAIFGTDGRLKMHNAQFAKLWQLAPEDLTNDPHVSRVAEVCNAKIDSGRIWELVLAGITSSTPEDYNAWTAVKRSDGSTISLSLTRLPDGATMAMFLDQTDIAKLETENAAAGTAAA